MHTKKAFISLQEQGNKCFLFGYMTEIGLSVRGLIGLI